MKFARFTVVAFHGVFARRLFLRFLVAAALPIVAVALLSFFNTSSVVSDQAELRLKRISHDRGLEVLARLSLAEDFLVRAGGPTLSTTATNLSRFEPFRSIDIFDAGNQPRRVAGTDSMPDIHAGLLRRARRDPGVTVIRVIGRGAGVIVMARALSDATHTGDKAPVVVGRLEPTAVWGHPDNWPAETQFCFFVTGSGWPINCSTMDAVFTAVSGDSRVTRLPVAGVEQLVAGWDLFLPSRFASPSWRIVAIQPWSYASGPVQTLYLLLPAVLVLSLLIAAILGLGQIRRISTPLRSLRAGVQRIAEGDFASRIEIDSADEFEELGGTINGMAERLGTQFHALETLATVDRQILAAASAEAVIDGVLSALHHIVPIAVGGVILFDLDVPTIARLSLIDYEHGQTIEHQRLQLTAAQTGELQVSEGCTLRLDQLAVAERAHLQPLAQRGVQSISVLPVREAGHCLAVLLLARRDGADLSTAQVSQGQAIAARLAVALAASQRERELYDRAHYDALTGLPNRALFMERLARQLAQSARYERRFAVAFLDLDRFKNVNDSAGHSVGDQLLVEAGGRINTLLREVDTVARWGGDEFVILLSDIESIEQVSAWADQLIATLSEAFQLGAGDHRVGASLGIALYPADGQNAEALLANADAAMYAAKAAGRGRCLFFEQEMNEAIRARVRLEAELRAALDDEQFFLVYQPLVRLSDGRIEAVEALLRWRHPSRGIVAPNEFVPALEETGLIVAAGAWVLRTACRQLAEGFGTPQARIQPTRVAVNVSARQFWAPGFVQSVEQALEESGLEGDRLDIEITESLLLDDLRQARALADQLHRRGVHLSMDDFGTGYSSLSYLRGLPVDTVKVDRAFVLDIERAGSEAATMMIAIISMLRGLGRRVVVEGVETAEQLAMLRGLDCDLAQGFYLSRPAPPDQLRASPMSSPEGEDS